MSPSEELRQAAKLMRERAEAATEGPWRAKRHRDRRSYVSSCSGACWDVAYPLTEDARHIAGMHPGVALAVADWLDRLADPVYCYSPGEYDAALNIARAYHGTTAPATTRED
jgi:hypothetical protein